MLERAVELVAASESLRVDDRGTDVGLSGKVQIPGLAWLR